MSRQLAELLLKDRIISPNQFNEAAEADKSGKEYVRYLIEKRYVSETKLLYHLSQKFGLPSVNLAKFEISPDVIKLIPGELVKRTNAIPIQSSKGTVVVAICDPTQLFKIEDLKFKLQTNIEAVLTSYSAFDAALLKYYGGAASVGAAIETYKKREATATGAEGTMAALDIVQVHAIETGGVDQDAPVITLVNGLLTEAIRRRASDIHVEPYEKRFRVRLRIDGTLVEVLAIPMEMRRAVIARMKIMSRLDIAETRVPQDGRIKLKVGQTEIDFRVNTMPTLFGEKIVMRLLSNTNLQLDLKKLGFDDRQLDQFRKGIHSANGLVLVTGPTGSGKTTTLYSALSELNQISDNLSTAEDPVEYNLDGINQVQVNKDVGLTFANVLRSLLRQDPDTILVGEIRDYETAEVAIQAALTGHLVLSSVHTNDAPSTVTRMVNMGVEPFLVTASVNTIVAQRLIRTICKHCAGEISVPQSRLLELGVPADIATNLRCFKGRGCANCNNTGYRGRVAIYEVLDFSPTLKEMVLRGETMAELKRQATREGMETLRMSALTRVIEGRTSLEEAISMTMEN